MKHYRSPSNELYAYEADGSQDAYIPANFVRVTDEEAEELRRANEQAAFDALSYSEKRAASYPDFREYLDAVVKGDSAQLNEYVAACRAVKLKYPKP